jgi:hypothetical protein
MNCIDQVVTDRYTAITATAWKPCAACPISRIGYSIFSPPFASLYTYSNSPRDMGNVRNDAEFFEHLRLPDRRAAARDEAGPERQLPLHGHAGQQGARRA